MIYSKREAKEIVKGLYPGDIITWSGKKGPYFTIEFIKWTDNNLFLARAIGERKFMGDNGDKETGNVSITGIIYHMTKENSAFDIEIKKGSILYHAIKDNYTI